MSAKQKLIDDVKILLGTNTEWSIRALTVIYFRQTYNEQDTYSAKIRNNIGFNSHDTEVLTELARLVDNNVILKQNQILTLFKLMPKYAKQYVEWAILEGKLIKVGNGKNERFVRVKNKN